MAKRRQSKLRNKKAQKMNFRMADEMQPNESQGSETLETRTQR